MTQRRKTSSLVLEQNSLGHFLPQVAVCPIGRDILAKVIAPELSIAPRNSLDQIKNVVAGGR